MHKYIHLEKKSTRHFFCLLPEIQSARLCIRLQLACHIRTSPELESTPGPDAMISTDKVQTNKQTKKKRMSDETVPRWWCRLSRPLTAAFTKTHTHARTQLKKKKKKFHAQYSGSLRIRRAAARTERRSHGSTSKSLSIRRHAQPWINLAVLLQARVTGAEAAELPLHNKSSVALRLVSSK